MQLPLVGEVVVLFTTPSIKVAELILDLTDSGLEAIDQRTVKLNRSPEI